jgi:hypothetical protein
MAGKEVPIKSAFALANREGIAPSTHVYFHTRTVHLNHPKVDVENHIIHVLAQKDLSHSQMGKMLPPSYMYIVPYILFLKKMNFFSHSISFLSQ